MRVILHIIEYDTEVSAPLVKMPYLRLDLLVRTLTRTKSCAKQVANSSPLRADPYNADISHLTTHKHWVKMFPFNTDKYKISNEGQDVWRTNASIKR